MHLSLREKDQAIKSLNEARDRLMDDMRELKTECKRNKVSSSQKNEVISIMNHQIDLLFGHKQKNEKLAEENQNLIMKVNLMQSVESILTSCQKDVDEILGQQLSVKDLSTMVGALKRELNNNELRKNELRRQLANVKNDLRAEQDVKKKLQDKVDYYESENHRLSNKCQKLTKTNSEDVIIIEDSFVGQTGTPVGIKKSRFAMLHLDGCQNTPSPLGTVSHTSLCLNVYLIVCVF